MFIGRKAQTCSSTTMKVGPKHSCRVLFQLGEEYSVRFSGKAPLTVKSRLNSNTVSLSELGDCGLVWSVAVLF